MFKIEYEAEDKSKQFAWQISYGLTTRTIGVMIMVHGDDKASCCFWTLEYSLAITQINVSSDPVPLPRRHAREPVMSIYLSVCPVCLSDYVSACMPACVCLSVCVCVSVCLSVCLSVSRSQPHAAAGGGDAAPSGSPASGCHPHPQLKDD